MSEQVSIFAGHCTVAEGEVRISRAVWRAVHPLAALATLAFLIITIILALEGPMTDGGRRYHWYHTLFMFLTVGGATAYNVVSYEVASDEQIPLADINVVRIKVERRRGYFKRHHSVPLVVVEYATGGETATYPIRLHRQQRAYESELLGLVDLFDAAGVSVVDEAGWLATDDEPSQAPDGDIQLRS